MKYHYIYIFLISILIFFSLALLNLILGTNFSVKEVDTQELLIRILPALTGSLFSALVAYFIFQLTKKK